MGDFNRTHTQLETWQMENDLQRAHQKIDIAQEHPDRKMYTYLRNSTTHSHIDYIYHSTLDPIIVSSVGATDHIHIHEKTDHFPIWIGLNWKGNMKEIKDIKTFPNITNQPDIDLEDEEVVKQFAEELDSYVEMIGSISTEMTTKQAACIQAAIFAKSAEIARAHSKVQFQTTAKRDPTQV